MGGAVGTSVAAIACLVGVIIVIFAVIMRKRREKFVQEEVIPEMEKDEESEEDSKDTHEIMTMVEKARHHVTTHFLK